MASATPKSVNYKFKWIIKNVTRENIMKHDSKNSLKSQIFQTWIDISLIEWYLQFYYNAKTQSVSLCLRKRKAHNDDILLNFRVKMHNHERSREIPQIHLYDFNLSLGWPKFHEFESLLDPTNKYIDEENCLTLNIEVKFTETLDDADKLRVASSIPTDLYSQFFNDKTFSDFTFKCSDGVEIPVHRNVLAAHSEVFMKMFTVEMQEKNSNSVVFKDTSSVTMKAALEFIYTRKCTFSDVESTIKVLDVSEKYEIMELKKLCIEDLMTKVTEQNVLDIFEIADLYKAILLERKCLATIIKNYGKLMKTAKYDKLEKPLIRKITDELARLICFVDNFSIESSL